MTSSHPLAAEVARLYHAGLGIHPICKQLRLGSATVREIRKALKLKPKRSGNQQAWSAEVMKAAVARYRQGEISIMACEDEFKLPRRSLRDYLQRLKLAARRQGTQEAPTTERPEPKGEPANLCGRCLCFTDRFIACGCRRWATP